VTPRRSASASVEPDGDLLAELRPEVSQDAVHRAFRPADLRMGDGGGELPDVLAIVVSVRRLGRQNQNRRDPVLD
jgi:hypothetical protein